MAIAANLGFPRLGVKREWKKASESYWAGKIDKAQLLSTADELTARHWKLQQDAGISVIPCNDFSFYDLMLDTSVLLGAVPPRYGWKPGREIDIDTYFAMARGRQDAPAMEMTKWFDTNYHYIVPEFLGNMPFKLASQHPFRAVERAREAGVADPRPTLIGPVSFLLLGKAINKEAKLPNLLDSVVDIYVEVLTEFAKQGVDWVQIEEPALVTDLDTNSRVLFTLAYDRLINSENRPRIMIATYFGGLDDNLGLALSLRSEGLHLDLVRAPGQLDDILARLGELPVLSLGVVDGRNVWRTDLDRAYATLETAAERIGHDGIEVAPSCSLLHSPIDLDLETGIDPEIREWMAFGKQKLQEVSVLTKAINEGTDSVKAEFDDCRSALGRRSKSPRVTTDVVQTRLAGLTEKMSQRSSKYSVRRKKQDAKLKLPLFATTTIGSFPQTREVRKLRAALRKGKLSAKEYTAALENEVISSIKFQEEIGLDILVHGEFERNDMVEYFGEQMEGYLFTRHGWVQSYGSRGVKPPIIFGDVHRRAEMTVRWSSFAQSKTDKPIKGMLTGPVTMMQWSFVRDDQLREITCRQLALAIRDEVIDLEKAGIGIIQIDEPAIREGLPLRRKDWDEYLKWAVDCFRLSSSGVRDETQIHTHMCYSEFNEMIESIAALDADVISIEASRSRMELLNCFEDFEYPNSIGPGIYDIHSPRVPPKDEIVELLQNALKFVPRDRLWVNPDCGLKTRAWPEVKESLVNMVEAARELRGVSK